MKYLFLFLLFGCGQIQKPTVDYHARFMEYTDSFIRYVRVSYETREPCADTLLHYYYLKQQEMFDSMYPKERDSVIIVIDNNCYPVKP